MKVKNLIKMLKKKCNPDDVIMVIEYAGDMAPTDSTTYSISEGMFKFDQDGKVIIDLYNM